MNRLHVSSSSNTCHTSNADWYKGSDPCCVCLIMDTEGSRSTHYIGITLPMIKLVSLMADTMQPTYQALAGYLSRRSGLSIELVSDLPWQERGHMLDQGEAQAGFICGWQYVRRFALPEPAIELLVAPVMHGARYGGRPIYFSDV